MRFRNKKRLTRRKKEAEEKEKFKFDGGNTLRKRELKDKIEELWSRNLSNSFT